jgi:hypothetical protein
MAKYAVCAAPGCGNTKHITGGYCSTHYQRLRRLGRLEGLKKPLATRGEPQRFLLSAFDYGEQDRCLIWPFGRDQEGRGRVNYKGHRSRLVHQVVCEAVHGPRPGPTYEVAHSCGKSHEACCNPHHLRWATHAENEADKAAHGTSQHGQRNLRAKLTDADVAEIRSLVGTESQRRIAERFGISQSAVSMIQRGLRWAA